MRRGVWFDPKGTIWHLMAWIILFAWRECIIDLLKILQRLVDHNVPFIWPFDLGSVLNFPFRGKGWLFFERAYLPYYFVNPKSVIWVFPIKFLQSFWVHVVFLLPRTHCIGICELHQNPCNGDKFVILSCCELWMIIHHNQNMHTYSIWNNHVGRHRCAWHGPV